MNSTYNNNNYDNLYPVNKCQVTLKNSELWKQFHNLETEMIITKSGRRMFPSLQVQLGRIDPQAHYCVFLEMMPTSRCRYKYSTAGGWAPAGSEEAQSPHRVYLHPESPATGEYWMSQPISFGRLKLTNMPSPPPGQIVLSSMHKYQPRIIIVQTSDPRINWAPSTYVEFPETQFIAVTAYQNEKITQLKIDNNPFAKGFRQNGQAKCKRKRICAEEKDDEDELICVVDDVKENNNASLCNSPSSVSGDSNEQVLSPRSRLSSEGDKEGSMCSSPLSVQGSPTIKCMKTEEFTDVSSIRKTSTISRVPEAHQPLVETFRSAPSYQYAPNPPPLFLPPNPFCPYIPVSYLPPSFSSSYYYPYGGYCDSNNVQRIAPSPFWYPQKTDEKYSRKLTDFSIKAILGY